MFGKFSTVPGASTPWTVVQPASIRTVEGLNIMFDDPRMAGGVVGLLNVMARAQDACDRTEYEHAFHEYAKMTRPRDQQAASTEMETDSAFGLT